MKKQKETRVQCKQSNQTKVGVTIEMILQLEIKSLLCKCQTQGQIMLTFYQVNRTKIFFLKKAEIIAQSPSNLLFPKGSSKGEMILEILFIARISELAPRMIEYHSD